MDDFADLEGDLLDDLEGDLLDDLEEDTITTASTTINPDSSLFGSLPQNAQSTSFTSATNLKSTNIANSKHAITDSLLASVEHFKSSAEFVDVLGGVAARRSKLLGSSSLSSSQSPPTYKEVNRGTKLMQAISDKTLDLHQLLVDLYNPKFPDLQNLVRNQEMYFRVVQLIGNSTDVASMGIESLLPKTDAIRVVVSGSTSNDQPLPVDIITRVLSACKLALALFDARSEISDMVMDGMKAIAPNVTALVGANVAAELIGLAGGLPELSRVPGGNMMLLGQQKKLDTGLSTSQQLHRGIIYKAPIVTKASSDLQRKVGREVANKVALAARVDSVGGSKDGSVGESFLKKIENKYRAHWSAPDVARTAKALPVPDVGEKKSRRGGRRKRAWKKKYGLTDVHKDANRVSFGSQHDEYSDSAMGKTFGTLGQKGSGRVRQQKQEQKVTLTKSAQRKLDRANSLLGKRKTKNSGLASSLMLDSDRGIEFVDPESAKKKLREVNSKYFGTKSGFRSVVPRLNK